MKQDLFSIQTDMDKNVPKSNISPKNARACFVSYQIENPLNVVKYSHGKKGGFKREGKDMCV